MSGVLRGSGRGALLARVPADVHRCHDSDSLTLSININSMTIIQKVCAGMTAMRPDSRPRAGPGRGGGGPSPPGSPLRPCPSPPRAFSVHRQLSLRWDFGVPQDVRGACANVLLEMWPGNQSVHRDVGVRRAELFFPQENTLFLLTYRTLALALFLFTVSRWFRAVYNPLKRRVLSTQSVTMSRPSLLSKPKREFVFRFLSIQSSSEGLPVPSPTSAVKPV